MANATNSAVITKEVIEGRTYYTTVRQGVEYCAYFMEAVGKWFVSTRRLALGRGHMGGGRYFEKVEDCKAFAALPVLIATGAL